VKKICISIGPIVLMSLLISVLLASPAQSEGACCSTDTCRQTTAAECGDLGGVYQGDGTTCDPNPCSGACCFSDNECRQTNATNCAVLGGEFYAGINCMYKLCGGACCNLATGTCRQTLADECTAPDEVYQGDSTTCNPSPCPPPPEGACCYPNQGHCWQATATDCVDFGGVYQGDGTTCDPNPCPQPEGACCNLTTGTCRQTVAADCPTPDEEYQGDGTTCNPSPCPPPPPTPVIAIRKARMVSSDELGVDLEVTFPPLDYPGQQQRRFVCLSAVVNGQPISDTFDITNLVQPGDEGKVIPFDYGASHGADPRVLDFAAAQVPRFESNQAFELIAEAYTSDGHTSPSNTEQVEIVLPVVIVHGYMGSDLIREFLGRIVGPWVYKELTDYLHAQTEGDFVTGYRTDDTWYKTLWLKYYPSRKFTPEEVETWLEEIIDLALDGTYADRVNLVCHSLGGLIGRYYSWHSRNARSHKVIMIGTPNYGSSKFYILTSDWKLKRVIKELNKQPLVRWLIPNRCLYQQGEFDCIYMRTGETVMPDLAVVRQDADWAYPEEFQDEIDPPEGVTYYSIYGVGRDTPDNLVVELQTYNQGTWYLVVDGGSSAGDGVVPGHSAALPSAVSISVPTTKPHGFLPTDRDFHLLFLAALGVAAPDGRGTATATDPGGNSSELSRGIQVISSSAIEAEASGLAPIGNHPNPFNPLTEISFSLPAASHVKLEIFNIVGQKVATLIDGQLEPGEHTIQWDGTDAASGVYFYRITAGEYTETKKMSLLK
jgi:pimeloyl-ACP methyl ester carboxylesterase